MTQGPRIRLVSQAEYEAAGALTVAAYRSVLGDTLDDDYAAVLASVADRAHTDTVLVAGDGRRLLGCVTYVGDPDSPNAEFPQRTDAGIRYLAVDPAAQGRGVGAGLVRACLQRARGQGKARVVLHTQVEMASAQRLYARLGFTRLPALDWRPLPDVRLVGLVKALRADNDDAVASGP